ncbi:MAG: helix-turn-helix domain-containing protein [Prevotellaceae bacterium]|jgi:AraC-like DNA-binding protein|nr:helix-turn-helix domain-containing protein [Prevotellaceae bacterium]
MKTKHTKNLATPAKSKAQMSTISQLILAPIHQLAATVKDVELLPTIHIIERNTRYLLSLVNQIIEMYTPGNRRQRQSKINIDLTHAYAQVEIEQLDKLFMKKLLAIMEDHYSHPDFGIAELRDRLGMSSTPFYKKIQTLTGLTPSHFIRLYRLQTAKRLLEDNAGSKNISVSEVAYMVGFNDPKYFSRCFMQHYHCSPSDILQPTR